MMLSLKSLHFEQCDGEVNSKIVIFWDMTLFDLMSDILRQSWDRTFSLIKCLFVVLISFSGRVYYYYHHSYYKKTILAIIRALYLIYLLWISVPKMEQNEVECCNWEHYCKCLGHRHQNSWRFTMTWEAGWRYGIISTVMVGVMVSYLRLWLALWYHIYGSLWTAKNIQTNNLISENIFLNQFNRPPVSSWTVNCFDVYALGYAH